MGKQAIDQSTILHELNFLKNNFKQYVAGNTYNGVALTVTGTNWTTAVAYFVPYRTIETSLGSDASYRLKFNIAGNLSVAASFIYLTVSGINIGGSNFPISGFSSSALTTVAAVDISVDQIRIWSSGNTTIFRASGDIMLTSWPTWADALI